MLRQIRDFIFGPRPKRHYEFALIHPSGGKVKDIHIWAENKTDARAAATMIYDTSSYLIGPAKEVDE